MPKEIAHFTIAGQVARNLPRTSTFFQAVQRFPFVFLFGAVCPDSPFYCLSGSRKKQVQALAGPFHRPGEDALVPVLKFLDRHRTPESFALAAGTVCHIMSDTTFHPLVYYYAGMRGKHTDASVRHKYFETAMDVHFSYLFPWKLRLREIVRQARISTPGFYALLSGLYSIRSPGQAVVKQVLRWHITIHALLGAWFIRRGTAMMAGTPLPVPGSTAGLIYPFGIPRFLPFFSGLITYRHPCTGVFNSTDFLTLITQAAKATITVLDAIDRAMGEPGENQDAIPLDSRVFSGPGLPEICPDLPVDTFDTWYGQQNIKPLLYQSVSMPF